MGKKHPRIFYGWWIVGACFTIALYTGGVIFYGFTAIFEPIAKEFGWSYAQISLAASLRGLEAGLLAPLFGILVDRWGPRRLIFGGTIITGLGLIMLSRITSLSMFYGAFILMGIGMSSVSSTVLVTAVANWFRRRMSMATGIMGSGWGFSGLLVPVVVSLIAIFEWRTALVILGLGVWVIGLPLSLLVRHKPEQYGYLPDGELSSSVIPGEGLTSARTAEEDIGVKQALKSGTFWHIALALMCHAIIVSAVVIHVMPYLSSIGIPRATSSLIAMAIPLTSIGGRLGLGWLGDRVDKRWISAGAFAMMGLGMFFFGYVATVGDWMLVPFLVLFGTGFGGNHIMRAAMLREYFGRSRFGTIFGFLMGVMMLGQIIGAPLAGWVFDSWGSYYGIWLGFAGLSVAAIMLVLTIQPVKTAVGNR